MIDLSVELCGVRLRNPLVLAAGILGTSAELLERVARNGAGAVTTKSYGPKPREGYPNPTVLGWGHGLINAIGLANPGVEEGVRIIARARERLDSLGVPLIASIFADTVDGFALMASRVSEAEPALIEVNISCPHVAVVRSFAANPSSAGRVMAAVREATALPLIVKLSPNVLDIAEIARAVEEAGADAISAVNTVGPGMVIDVYSGRPILANRVGGVSGPAIKPIAVRCVYEICRAVRIPVIGIGGVTTGLDAVEMVMAGATAVGIGSAICYGGVGVFGKILREMASFMVEQGYETLADFRGMAHEN